MIKRKAWNKAALLLCVCRAVAVRLPGTYSVGTNDNLTGESYPDAENYQTGAFTYHADEIKAVEVYWRSGEVEITESDSAEVLYTSSSGELLTDRTYERKGDLYVFGSGDSKINVETSSGNLEIQ